MSSTIACRARWPESISTVETTFWSAAWSVVCAQAAGSSLNQWQSKVLTDAAQNGLKSSAQGCGPCKICASFPPVPEPPDTSIGQP